MKNARTKKPKRTAAKKPAARVVTKPARRAPLKMKQRLQQSVARQKRVVREQASLPPVSVTAVERSSMPYLFWPALPFAMMNIWWRTGQAARR